MQAFAAAAVFVAANAVSVSQHNPYYQYNPYNYNSGTNSARYVPEGNGVIRDAYVEPVRDYIPVEPVIEREFIPQIVPVCPKKCAKATILDAWEGNLGNGQFGTHGEVTFEQNCNESKTTIRGSFKNLRVTQSINGAVLAQTT